MRTPTSEPPVTSTAGGESSGDSLPILRPGIDPDREQEDGTDREGDRGENGDLREAATSYDEQLQADARENGRFSNIYASVAQERESGPATVGFTNNRDVAVTEVDVTISARGADREPHP